MFQQFRREKGRAIVQTMFRLSCVMLRQTRRGVHTCVGGMPSLMTSHPIKDSPLKGSLLGFQAKPRLLSSLDTEEFISNPFSLVEDDMKAIYNEVMTILRKNIKNADVFNIINSYYEGLDNNVGASSALVILIAKAVNYHKFNSGDLTDTQVKVLAILEIILSTVLLRDDIVDDSETRRGLPTAHMRWDPYRVVMAGNVANAICLGEAAKLRSNVTVSLCKLIDVTYKGQFMSLLNGNLKRDLFTSYKEEIYFKGGTLTRFVCEALARAGNSSDLIEENISRFGYNLGMSHCIIDDVRDFKQDLGNGIAKAPVLFAMKEHPILEEIVMRSFKEKGDVEKTIELVNNSRGLDLAREFSASYSNTAVQCFSLLADSRYKTALQTILQFHMLSMNADFAENSIMDLYGEKGF